MLIPHIYWIFVIWLATTLVGLVSMPACRLIFKFSSDRGYAFSKIIGWLAVSYIAFFAASFKLLPLSLTALTAAFFLWLAFNLYLFLKNRKGVFPSLKSIITTEIIFLLAFSGLVLVKSFQPEIYQIERFMDFGFIQALRNSNFLPLQDIWLAGSSLNYYYFGHFIGFVILSFTGIDTLSGFYLLTALIFALLACAIYRLAKDMAFLLINGKGEGWQSLAGFLSIFSVLIAGTWYMVPRLFKASSFFYPEPTRIISGTITEMPIYSFLVAELHAHVWGLLSGILILAILYSFFREESPKFGFKSLYFWSLAFVLGLAFMINSWDALTLGFLSVAVLFVKYWKSGKLRFFIFTPLLASAAYAIALPWTIFYRPPVQEAGFIFFPSAFWPWLSFWGSVVIIPIIYFILFLSRLRRERFSSQQPRQNFYLFPALVMLSGIFFLILVELVYAKDVLSQGEWYRANTVFKAALQIWLWISIFAGPLSIWLYFSFKKRLARITCIALLAVYVFVGSIYPVIAVKQSSLDGKKLTGINSGIDWWSSKYPDDYEAYFFLENLKKNLPEDERMKTIIEAEGDSYTDISRFSVFLGWPTVIGWPVHEWTWRGGYDEVGRRREEVRKVYTSFNAEETQRILDFYNVDYIIVGQVEKARYGEFLRTEKLRRLGDVIFEKGETFVVELNGI